MKNRVVLFVLAVLMSLPFISQPVQGQETAVRAGNYYLNYWEERQDLVFPDYVVQFFIPSNATWRIEATGTREKKLLDKIRSKIDDRQVNGRVRTIKVVAGVQDRISVGYFEGLGSIEKFAKSLTVYYKETQPIQPRGPAATPTPTPNPTPRSTPTPAPTPKPTPVPTPTPAYGRANIAIIKKNATGTGTTEVHILSGQYNLQRFALNTGTAQHVTGDEYIFRMADWNRDGQPDLFGIKKNMTGTGSTEVHILSGAGYQQFLLHIGTPQPETWYEYDFQVADWNRDGYQDLIIIKKYNTGTRSTEVHILSGATNFQQFILHTGTPQEETGDNYDFDMADWDRDGYPDLVIIKKNGTGTGMTEVHILSGASNFQRFLLHTGTAQQPTGNEYVFRMGDWDGDGKPDLFGIKKNNTGTRSTEVHILSGASNFQKFLLQTGTAQEEIWYNYDFDVIP